MDMQRFQTCADSYGARRDRWPPQDQGLFDALSCTPEGVRVLAQAEQVDAFLDRGCDGADEPSPLLRQRIAKPPARHRAASAEHRARRWLPLVAMVLILGLGFALGFHGAVEDEAGLAVMGRLMMDPASGPGGVL